MRSIFAGKGALDRESKAASQRDLGTPHLGGPLPFPGDAERSCPAQSCLPRPLNLDHGALPRKPQIVLTNTFTLFVLSPGVENPAAEAGIDSSFAEVKRPTPQFGVRHVCIGREAASAADGFILVARWLSHSPAPASRQWR